MNILFFLTPKAMCAYIESDDTLRQAMERMEHSGYAALPVLDKSGKYCGVVTEGDLLWTLKRLCVMDLRQTEEHSISEIEHPHRAARAGRHARGGSDLRRRRAELRPRDRRQGRFHRHRHPQPHSPVLLTDEFPARIIFLRWFNPPVFGTYLASEVQNHANKRKSSEPEADPEFFP